MPQQIMNKYPNPNWGKIKNCTKIIPSLILGKTKENLKNKSFSGLPPEGFVLMLPPAWFSLFELTVSLMFLCVNWFGSGGNLRILTCFVGDDIVLPSLNICWEMIKKHRNWNALQSHSLYHPLFTSHESSSDGNLDYGVRARTDSRDAVRYFRF